MLEGLATSLQSVTQSILPGKLCLRFVSSKNTLNYQDVLWVGEKYAGQLLRVQELETKPGFKAL